MVVRHQNSEIDILVSGIHRDTNSAQPFSLWLGVLQFVSKSVSALFPPARNLVHPQPNEARSRTCWQEPSRLEPSCSDYHRQGVPADVMHEYDLQTVQHRQRAAAQGRELLATSAASRYRLREEAPVVLRNIEAEARMKVFALLCSQ